MKIRTVEFVGSLVEAGGRAPLTLPQVAFSGRSNVGKSSLINCLVQRTEHRLAGVSARPGKTQQVNFYHVNHTFLIVDLPGLGYAKAPRPLRHRWWRLVLEFLSASPELRAVAHLVDARHGPGPEDRHLLDLLARRGVPLMLVVTKIDKLPRSRWAERVQVIAEALGMDPEQVLPFSARTGEGREELLDAIASILAAEGGDDR
ncbi:MAG: YihA family ribosome biogenesis GTP-binding protein [Gemmatimonadetes bacterium]|nr:YihA family ribosome biogenesis GTP-binding protein [Gemmatimonadota bacterium]